MISQVIRVSTVGQQCDSLLTVIKLSMEAVSLYYETPNCSTEQAPWLHFQGAELAFCKVLSVMITL